MKLKQRSDYMTSKEYKTQLALGSISYIDKLDLACNTNTPVDILRILSKDKEWRIRYYVANNTNTPIDILRILSKDKNSNVRSRALESISRRDNCS